MMLNRDGTRVTLLHGDLVRKHLSIKRMAAVTGGMAAALEEADARPRQAASTRGWTMILSHAACRSMGPPAPSLAWA